jgi:hypothetical protein
MPVVQTTDNHFYQIRASYPLSEARAAEGIVTNLLETRDQQERFSLAMIRTCAARKSSPELRECEESRAIGVVLHFRQTLMTTYLIYSALGYMGTRSVTDAHFETIRHHEKSE